MNLSACLTAALTVTCLALALNVSAAQADIKPFGLSCETTVENIRFCPATTYDQRIPSFDNLPIDADVTLPATGSGPFPTLFLLHGYSQNKKQLESSTIEGDNPLRKSYNNLFFASKGYAVVTYSARGNGDSCGSEASRTADCATGWSHLADQRYETRDLQHLIGLLVDEGIADPNAIGLTGTSYGGSAVTQAAFLYDKVRLTDGTLSPWVSPKGVPLKVGAAYSRWSWFDLAQSLLPNGRPDSELTIKNVGIKKDNFLDLLFSRAAGDRFDAPTGVDPTADVNTWKKIADDGEPYPDAALTMVQELKNNHGPSATVGASNTLPPMLIQSGWTDDLFPATEGFKTYRAAQKIDPNAKISLQFGDFGHPRGKNRDAEAIKFNLDGLAFFDYYLRGTGTPPKVGGVSTYQQNCEVANDKTSTLITADNLDGLARKSFTVKSKKQQVIDSKAGNLGIASAISQMVNVSSCAKVKSDKEPGTARYLSKKKSVTVAGPTELTVKLKTKGGPGQLAVRIWDIDPDGGQVLVDRGVYRLTKNQRGTVKFSLHGNVYRVAKKHRLAIQLLGRDTGFLQPSAAKYKITIKSIKAVIPTR